MERKGRWDARWRSRRGIRDRERGRDRCLALRTRLRCRSADAASIYISPFRTYHERRTHHKHDESRLCQRSPNRLHRRVVQSLSHPLRPHHDSPQMLQALHLLHRLQHLPQLHPRHERQASEREQPLLRLRDEGGRVRGGVGRAVGFDIVVEVTSGGDGFGGGEEVEPRVGEGNDLRVERISALSTRPGARGRRTETSMPWQSINLIFSV